MKHLAYILAGLSVLSACGGGDSSTPTPTPTAPRTAETAGTAGATRLCTAELGAVTTGRLVNFFGISSVKNIEGAPTFCLTVSGGGSNLTGSTLRIEYEDDYGIRAYNADGDNYFMGSVVSTDTTTTLEVVFIDDYGLVQVKGTMPVNSGNFVGSINYYNFPSYEEALNAQVQEAQDKCKTGAYTVAQCMGYNFPSTYWWNQTLYTSESQRLRDQAKALLANTSKTKQLGTINVDSSAIKFE